MAELLQRDIDEASQALPASEKPGICFIIDRLSVAGTESQLLNLIRQVDRTKFAPHLVLLDGTSKESQALEPDCCPVVRLGIKRVRSLFALQAGIRFAKYLKLHNVKILHAYFPDSMFFGFSVSRLAGIPHFVRNRRNLGYSQTKIQRMLGRAYSRTAIKTVTNSEACRQAIIEQEGAKPSSVTVIPNGIELRRFANLPSPELQKGSPKVGMVANLRTVKDPMTLVKACIKLSKEFPHLQLQIAGEGNLRASLQKNIDDAGLRDQFELIGRLNDVSEFIGSLDIAVLSSTSEGLSNSVIEYMAAARPIVVSNVGGNAELIDHEVSGLLVEPRNVDQFVSAIRRLLDDREFAIRCGEAAREKALANYRFDRPAKRFHEFWDNLLVCAS